MYLHKVTIEPDEESFGATFGEESRDSQASAIDGIMVACAGYAALVVAGFGKLDAERGCEHDFAVATELIRAWGLAPLRNWQERTIEYMARQENVLAVKLLSKVLLEYGTVGSEHAQVLVELADGEISEADWLDFIARWPVLAGDPSWTSEEPS